MWYWLGPGLSTEHFNSAFGVKSMKIVRPARLDNDGNDIPPLAPIDKNMKSSPIAIGVMLVLLFIIGSSILLFIFSFYDKYFGEPEQYVPGYITLRDGLTMPDGRNYWDDNNHTDMMIAAGILETYLDKKIAEQNQTNLTIDEFFDSMQKSGPSGGGQLGGRTTKPLN